MTRASLLEAEETYTWWLVYYAVAQGLWPRLGASAGAKQLEAAARDLARLGAQPYSAVEPPPDPCFTGTREPTAAERDREWALQCVILRREAGRVVFKQQAPPLPLGEPEPLPSQGAPLVEHLLGWLKQAKLAVANSALRSKVKDEKRGEKIIPGYVEAHGAVDKHDAIVKRAFQDAERVGNEVDNLLRQVRLENKAKL